MKLCQNSFDGFQYPDEKINFHSPSPFKDWTPFNIFIRGPRGKLSSFKVSFNSSSDNDLRMSKSSSLSRNIFIKRSCQRFLKNVSMDSIAKIPIQKKKKNSNMIDYICNVYLALCS